MKILKAYIVFYANTDWHAIAFARSAGQAKTLLHRLNKPVVEGSPYTDVRAHRVKALDGYTDKEAVFDEICPIAVKLSAHAKSSGMFYSCRCEDFGADFCVIK